MFDWAFNSYLWPYVACMGLQLWALVRGAQHRQSIGVRSYLVFMVACLVYTASFIIEYGAQNVFTASVAVKLSYTMSPYLSLSYFLLVLHAIGLRHRVSATWVIVLFCIATSIVVLGLTADFHRLHLYDLRLATTTPFTVLVYKSGPGFIADMVYTFTFPLVVTVLVLRFAWQTSAFYRRRARILLVAIVLPWISTILFIFNLGPVKNYNLGILFLTVSGMLIAHAIRSGHLLDLIPVARHLIVEQMGQAMVIINEKGVVIDCNAAAESLFGMSKDELIGCAAQQLEQRAPLLRSVLSTPVEEHTACLDGPYYQVRAAPISGTGPGGMIITFTDITVVKKAEELLQQSKHELEQLVARRTQDLEQTNRELAAQIEERKRSQQQQAELEKQLQLKRRLEALGTFASGIAHDFNNILFAIQGYADLGKSIPQQPDEATDAFAEIHKAAKRAGEVVKQILTFSRSEEPDLRPVACGQILQDVVGLMKAGVAGNVRLETEIGACPPVAADPAQLHQAVLNLVTNAVQSLDDREGTVRLRLRFLPKERDTAAGMAEITVEDTGKGIAKADLERIFEPFYTTKAPGAGSGLGLSVTHGVVQGHKGEITVASEPGKGSAFCIRLPVLSSPTGAGMPDSVAPLLSGQGIRVLFVDDEPAIRRIVSKFLTRLGFSISTADSAERALEIIAADSWDVVVTDQKMSGMTGLEMVDVLKRQGFNRPVILLSGHLALEYEQTPHDTFEVKLLEKPIQFTDLGQTIIDLHSNHLEKELNE